MGAQTQGFGTQNLGFQAQTWGFGVQTLGFAAQNQGSGVQAQKISLRPHSPQCLLAEKFPLPHSHSSCLQDQRITKNPDCVGPGRLLGPTINCHRPFPPPQSGSLALGQVLKFPPPPQQTQATGSRPRLLQVTGVQAPCFLPLPPTTAPSPAPRHTPRRGAPSLTFEGPFRAPHFIRTLHISGLEAPRRRLPFHPRRLPVRRRGRWWTILRLALSAPRPKPSPPARSAPARGPGCPAPAPEAGRLDTGPLRPAGPLPYPRPRPHPQGLSLPWGPRRPPSVVASEVRGFTTRLAAPGYRSPTETPSSGLPAPGWAAAGRPPPLRTGSVRPRPVSPDG